MILAGLTLPRTSGASRVIAHRLLIQSTSFPVADYSLVYYFALWFTMVVLSTIFIFIHGLDYVAWPRLLPPTDVIHYNGPGFRSSRHGTGFGLDFGKLKSGANAQWVTRGLRRSDMQMEEIELGAKRHVD
jgi:hypothetical protein